MGVGRHCKAASQFMAAVRGARVTVKNWEDRYAVGGKITSEVTGVSDYAERNPVFLSRLQHLWVDSPRSLGVARAIGVLPGKWQYRSLYIFPYRWQTGFVVVVQMAQLYIRIVTQHIAQELLFTTNLSQKPAETGWLHLVSSKQRGHGFSSLG